MPIRVNYVTVSNDSFASYRYRIGLIGKYLGNCLVTYLPVEADVHVFSKAVSNDQVLLLSILRMASGLNFVFDVCDDVFRRSGISRHYTVEMCRMARVVTVPTKEMAEVVSRETSVEPVVICDPCEFPEKPIKDISEKRLLWFGNELNLNQLKDLKLDSPLEVVCKESTRDTVNSLPFETKFTEWSLGNMREAFDRNNVVIIPSDDNYKRQVKSPNRVVESIRNGLSVVAYPLPSYSQFGEFVTLDTSIERGLKDLKQLSREAQEYVSETFDISVIGEQWKTLFDSTLDVETKSSMVG